MYNTRGPLTENWWLPDTIIAFAFVKTDYVHVVKLVVRRPDVVWEAVAVVHKWGNLEPAGWTAGPRIKLHCIGHKQRHSKHTLSLLNLDFGLELCLPAGPSLSLFSWCLTTIGICVLCIWSPLCVSKSCGWWWIWSNVLQCMRRAYTGCIGRISLPCHQTLVRLVQAGGSDGCWWVRSDVSGD